MTVGGDAGEPVFGLLATHRRQTAAPAMGAGADAGIAPVTPIGQVVPALGAGAGMVYLAGKPDHKQSNETMIDHIVELVEAKAAELDAAKRVAEAAE